MKKIRLLFARLFGKRIIAKKVFCELTNVWDLQGAVNQHKVTIGTRTFEAKTLLVTGYTITRDIEKCNLFGHVISRPSIEWVVYIYFNVNSDGFDMACIDRSGVVTTFQIHPHKQFERHFDETWELI